MEKDIFPQSSHMVYLIFLKGNFSIHVCNIKEKFGTIFEILFLPFSINRRFNHMIEIIKRLRIPLKMVKLFTRKEMRYCSNSRFNVKVMFKDYKSKEILCRKANFLVT